MDCRRVEELIPLYVEGDLGEPQAGGVRAHAQACEACRRLVAEYGASQAWLRANDAPEFDAAFVDTVRAGVMRELAAEEARRPFVERLRDWLAPRRLALVTAALAAIFVALALFVYLNRARVEHQDEQTAQDNPAPRVEKRDDVANTPTVISEQTAPLPKRRSPRRAAPRVKTPDDDAPIEPRLAVQSAVPLDNGVVAAQTEEKLRIEIQTADPNIRIIWFAPKPTETEAP